MGLEPLGSTNYRANTISSTLCQRPGDNGQAKHNLGFVGRARYTRPPLICCARLNSQISATFTMKRTSFIVEQRDAIAPTDGFTIILDWGQIYGLLSRKCMCFQQALWFYSNCSQIEATHTHHLEHFKILFFTFCSSCMSEIFYKDASFQDFKVENINESKRTWFYISQRYQVKHSLKR